jgi:hypothetical protein
LEKGALIQVGSYNPACQQDSEGPTRRVSWGREIKKEIFSGKNEELKHDSGGGADSDRCPIKGNS